MVRIKLIAANWKMYKNFEESGTYAVNFKPLVANVGVEILICPAYPSIIELKRVFRRTKIKVGAQDIHFERKGAFTGEVSADMVKNVGAEYVILGHSERRHIFHETDDIINKKVKAAIASHIIPILCIGETLEQRKTKKTFDVLKQQLDTCLQNIQPKDISNIVIAYEPVWAISTSGTGKKATPKDVEDEHTFIRDYLDKKYLKRADKIRILYGGSVDNFNVKGYLDLKDVDGALVGGASLTPTTFAEIIHIASNS